MFAIYLMACSVSKEKTKKTAMLFNIAAKCMILIQG